MSRKRLNLREQKYTICVFIEEVNGLKDEQKTVVPMRWLDPKKKILWWPKGINVTSKKFSDPDEKSWNSYELVEVLEEGNLNFLL